jgi:type I restriction enzyme S subunit
MKKNQDFIQTEIGKMPKKWKVVRLGDEEVAVLIMGQSPPSSTYNNTGIGLPFLQGNAEFGEMYPTPVLSCSHPIKITEKNDILLSVRAPVGDVNIAPFKSCIGRGLAAIRPKWNKLDYLFLFYYLKLESRLFESLSMGSTFKAIRKIEIEKFRVPLPPVPEQKKIAEILSTVDETIERVDEAIAKTERLKKGLMQELLTKGIGHKEFTHTEIGSIPKEWEVVRLGDNTIAEIRGNKAINEFEKVAFIPMEFIPDSGVFVRYEVRPMKEVKSFTYCESRDLLLAKITPSLENGKQGIIPDDIPNGFALATTEVFPISCKNIYRLFLFYILKFPKFRNKIIASMTGTTGRQRASKESLKNLLIPFPPIPEQKKIAEILSTVDKRLELLREKKEGLKKVKRGLMNDLLTGKKRVKLEA